MHPLSWSSPGKGLEGSIGVTPATEVMIITYSGTAAFCLKARSFVLHQYDNRYKLSKKFFIAMFSLSSRILYA